MLVAGNLAAQPSATAPAVSAKGVPLLIAPAHESLRLSPAELKAMATHGDVHHLNTNADEAYSGVRLSDLLARLGAPLQDAPRGKALAGMLLPLDPTDIEASGHRRDRSELPEKSSSPTRWRASRSMHTAVPFQLVVSEDKRLARSVRNLAQIEMKMAN